MYPIMIGKVVRKEDLSEWFETDFYLPDAAVREWLYETFGKKELSADTGIVVGYEPGVVLYNKGGDYKLIFKI